MAIRYLYNNQKYNSLYALRQAIYKTERIAYGNPTQQEEFDKLPLKYKVTIEEYDPQDEINLEVFRNQKKSAMQRNFEEYKASKHTSINSSLGFRVNANDTAYMDIDGLCALTEAYIAEQTLDFRDYTNTIQKLTHAQLLQLKKELAQNRTRAYQKKWEYEQVIAQADRAALKNMSHFSFE